MITLEDVQDMSALSRAEIEALSEHKQTSILDAILMGDYMMHVYRGPHKVHEMICDDIRAALHKDDLRHAHDLFAVLRAFLAEYPEAARGAI